MAINTLTPASAILLHPQDLLGPLLTSPGTFWLLPDASRLDKLPGLLEASLLDLMKLEDGGKVGILTGM